jgi:hypothetical protein
LKAGKSKQSKNDVTAQGIKTTPGKNIEYNLDKQQYNTKPTLKANIVLLFSIPGNADPSKILINLKYTIRKKDKLTLLRPVILHYSIGCGLSLSKHPNSSLVIGIVAFPKCEKSAFLNVLLDRNTKREAFQLMNNPYLHKKQFKNFQFRDKIWDIAFLDTPHDQNLLDKFVQGLKEGTLFSKHIPTDNLITDINNRPSHLILAITARELYKK